ncbi:hypothetical protein [Geodermatophilus sp. SYSU D00710]
MDLDEVADELYGLAPGDFVAARTEAARRARAAGDRALAQRIAALGKPTTAAWACNALVREQPDEIAGLVELGGLLREAQQTLAGDQLRALGTQRSRLLAALTRQARAVAARLGHPLSDAVADGVEQTLRAALADPEAGEALLAGRLTGPLSPRGTGLGTRPDLRVVPPPATARRPARHEADGRAAGRREDEEEARQRDEEARRRDEAEARRRRAAEERRQREIAEAREDAEAAADVAEEAARSARTARDRAERARRRAADLAARVADLAAELARVREEAAQAETEAATASRRAGAADRAAERAAAERDRAAARVTELEDAPPAG